MANLRNPVRFSQAVAAAGRDYATFVEVSPHPLLTYAISDTLGRAHHHSIGTLQRDTDDTLTFHTNLNATHTTHPHTRRTRPNPIRPFPLPPGTTHSTGSESTSPWTPPESTPRPGTLLGEHISVTTTPPAHLWQALLAPEAKPYPGRHRINGMELVPVSVLLQTLSTAAAESGASILSDVRFEYPIVVDQPRVIQVIADDQSVTVSSSPAADTPSHRWVRHATARISHRLDYDEPEGTDMNGDHEPAGFDASSVAELQRAWGIEGQPFPLVDRLLPVGGGWIARGRRRAGGVDGRTARRRRSRRTSGRQLEPAAHVSGLGRKCPVRRRAHRCARLCRGTSARRQRR